MNPIFKDFNTEISYLNTNLQNIGKYTRQGIFWYKSFLSFDKNGHLKIRQLNLLQILTRRFLGWYQDTTLRNVIKSWDAYQIKHGNICPELTEKLSSLWKNNYFTVAPFRTSDTFYIGNSKIENAEVIGIGQVFSDPNNSAFCGKLLSLYYKPGNIILVEGVDAGRILSSDQNPQTSLLKSSAEIHGWEPMGYEALNARVFESTLSIENQFRFSASMALKLINNKNFQKNEGSWNQLFISAMENFFEAIDKMTERLPEEHPSDSSDKLPRLEEFKKQHQFFLESQKTNDECKSFIEAFKHFFKKYHQSFQKSKYTHKWTAAQDNFFKNTWGIRQQSLSNEIERFRKLGKRIFVCAGASHFFPNRGKNDSSVMATLQQYKFTVGLNNIKQNATYYSFDALAKKFSEI